MGTRLILTTIRRAIAAQMLSSARGLSSVDKAADKFDRICGYCLHNDKRSISLNEGESGN